MPVMDIGPVLVFVNQRRMRMFVTVRTGRVGAGRMFVLVMQIVVAVQVGMRDRLRARGDVRWCSEM